MKTSNILTQRRAQAIARPWRMLRPIELRLGLILIVASVVLPAWADSAYWSHIFLLLNLFLVVAICQNFLLADAGQVSFGQGAVFGTAAYTVGMVCGLHEMGIVPGLILGTLAGLALGAVFALPALRVSGFYLGFVTLSVAMVLPEMLNYFSDFTNGINGISLTDPFLHEPAFFGLSRISVLILLLSSGVYLMHAWLRQTTLGRKIRVAASSPEAAMTIGFSPSVVRSIAFFIAALGSALAGTLYGPLVGYLSPDAFHFDLSIFFFFAVIIGGSGSLIGPLLGVVILYLVPNVLLLDLVNYRMLGYGIVALLIVLLFPDGITGTLRKRLFRREPGRPPASVTIDTLYRVMRARRQDLSLGSASSRTTVLQTIGLCKRFGQTVALDEVELAVRRGCIHGIVGPNGSGKTTLLNALSGLISTDSGSIYVLDKDAGQLSPDAIARLGIARSFQTPRIFDALSTFENVCIGLDAGADAGPRLQQCLKALKREWKDDMPDTLPHAQRRSLELLRGLVASPEILLLDEPAAGLSREERAEFATLLKQLRDELELTIILVEHDLKLIWDVADEVTCMDAGRVVVQGAPGVVRHHHAAMALFGGVQGHA